MRHKALEHEIIHAIAAAADIVEYAGSNHLSGVDLLRSASCLIDADAAGDGIFGLAMKHRGCKLHATAVASLAPGVTDDTARSAIAHRDASKLFESGPSDVDVAVFGEDPVPLEQVVRAGLSAQYYLQQFTPENSKKLIDLVGKSSRNRDGVLPLSLFVDYDKLKACMDLAKARVSRLFTEEHDPAQMQLEHEEELRKSHEFKQSQYAKASPAEKRLRDQIRCGLR